MIYRKCAYLLYASQASSFAVLVPDWNRTHLRSSIRSRSASNAQSLLTLQWWNDLLWLLQRQLKCCGEIQMKPSPETTKWGVGVEGDGWHERQLDCLTIQIRYSCALLQLSSSDKGKSKFMTIMIQRVWQFCHQKRHNHMHNLVFSRWTWAENSVKYCLNRFSMRYASLRTSMLWCCAEGQGSFSPREEKIA